jgi:hypothetical protein
MSEIIEHGDENSIYINHDMDKYIGELGYRKNSFADVFENALRKACKLEELKRLKRRFDDGDTNLGELLDEVDNL